MKKLEIEKRILLKGTPKITYDEALFIQQYYTPTGRYRQVTSSNLEIKYIHTIKKSVSKGVNEETEIEISHVDFSKAIKKATKHLSKTRYIKKAGKYKWEIDKFDHCNIVIAEIEVNSKKELKTVKLPKYIKENFIIDVTGIKEFSNFNLAEKWKKKK